MDAFGTAQTSRSSPPHGCAPLTTYNRHTLLPHLHSIRVRWVWISRFSDMSSAALRNPWRLSCFVYDFSDSSLVLPAAGGSGAEGTAPPRGPRPPSPGARGAPPPPAPPRGGGGWCPAGYPPTLGSHWRVPTHAPSHTAPSMQPSWGGAARSREQPLSSCAPAVVEGRRAAATTTTHHTRVIHRSLVSSLLLLSCVVAGQRPRRHPVRGGGPARIQLRQACAPGAPAPFRLTLSPMLRPV